MSAIETAPEVAELTATETLPEHAIFEGLSGEHRQILADCSKRGVFRAGEKIVETGEPADCFYLIIRGSAQLETPGSRSRLARRTIGAGDIIGWSWLFPPDFWHFDAVALETTEVIYFYGSRLRQECDRDQGLGYELFTRLARSRREGRSTLLTPDAAGNPSQPPGIESEEESSSPVHRANFDAFARTPEALDESNRGWLPSALGWPKIILDSARATIRSVSGAPSERPAPALPRG